MLEAITQIIAAAGPITLAIMGVAVSLNPPSATGRAHYIWAAAFFVVGVISAGAVFMEIRGTDETLNALKTELAALKKESQRAPRLEFSGVKSSRESGGQQTTNITFINTSDIDIIDYYLSGSVYTLDSEPDDAIFNSLRDAVRRRILARKPGMTAI